MRDFPQFHAIEYDYLVKSLAENHELNFKTTVQTTIANAVIIAWSAQLISTGAKGVLQDLVPFILFAPIILSLFALLRGYHTRARSRALYAYMHLLEEKYADRECGLGFQHFYRENRQAKYLRYSSLYISVLIIQFAFVLLLWITLGLRIAPF